MQNPENWSTNYQTSKNMYAGMFVLQITQEDFLAQILKSEENSHLVAKIFKDFSRPKFSMLRISGSTLP